LYRAIESPRRLDADGANARQVETMIGPGESGSLVGTGPAMRASFHFPPVQRATGTRAAPTEPAAVLGPGHPLVGVLQACQAARTQMVAIATIQVASAAVLPAAPRLGGALLIAATAVQLALGLRLVVLAGTRCDLARQLIVEGRSPSHLAALEHEWRRLADPRQRARLARSLEQLADMAERPSSYLTGARPYFNARVVRAVAPELRELGALLRGDGCSPRGVALLQSLQCSGASALYGDATRPLQEELARARYLLLDREPEP
jgi:hypothetical protein